MSREATGQVDPDDMAFTKLMVVRRAITQAQLASISDCRVWFHYGTVVGFSAIARDPRREEYDSAISAPTNKMIDEK